MNFIVYESPLNKAEKIQEDKPEDLSCHSFVEELPCAELGRQSRGERIEFVIPPYLQ